MNRILFYFSIGLFFSLFSPALFAQDLGFNYQAVARDGQNNLITNTNLSVEFIIKDQANTPVFSESQLLTTNEYGLFTGVIGSTDFATFSSIDWGTGKHGLQVKINPGTGVVDLGTTPFEAVPYSKLSEFSRTSELSKLATEMKLAQLEDVKNDAPSNGQILTWNGSEWEPEDAASSSLWSENGSDISYDAGNIGIGVTNPAHPLHIVHATTTQNTISVEAGSPPSGRDVLEIRVDAATADGAQFIELERGNSIVASISADGSARFKDIVYSDGTIQKVAGPIAKGHLDITNTSTGAVTVNGTSGMTAIYNNTRDYIEVTVAGETLSPSTHLVQVVPIRINTTTATLDRSVSIYFTGGKVRIYVWDASAGTAVANDCQISISEL